MQAASVRSEAPAMVSGEVAGIAVSEETNDRPTVKGARQALADGGSMLAVSYANGDTIVATYDVTTKAGTTRRLTRVFRVTGEDTSRLIAEADDGAATGPSH
jgi:hypothetical protein